MLNYEQQQYPNAHTNKFIVLHGVPYLVGEYVDRTKFTQLDPALVGEGIIIDQTEPMRTIIDVQISDIERRNSDGRLSTIGNSSKLSNMIDIIKHYWDRPENRLRVLRNGLVVRIFYQLENARTGLVLRSMTESFRIEDANYFVYVNPENISDNSLIVNFSDSKLTNVSQFTYGRDPMMLRITGIQLFYEVAEINPLTPRVEKMVAKDPYRSVSYYGPDADAFYYHQEMQNVHHLENWNWRADRCQVPPDTWTAFNRFYHFDEEAQYFQIHFDEVYSKRCKVIPLACGKINLNKVFIVNPGTRLVFKFCIWKNDAIITSKCAAIADALRIPQNTIGYIDYKDHDPRVPQSDTSSTIIPSYTYEPRPIPQSTPIDYAQNAVINQLIDVVASLEAKVAQLTKTDDTETGGDDGNTGSTEGTGTTEDGSTEPSGSENP